MADFKHEVKNNNENNGQSSVHASKNMHETARKKQAFVELKNVIHIQSQPKPFKCENIPSSHRPKNRNSVIQPLPAQQNDEIPVIQIREPETESEKEEVELLNYFDFDRSCCSAPYKGDRQIWSESNMFDDSLINKILQSGMNDKEEENNEPLTIEDSLDDSGCEDLLNMNSSMLFTASINSDSGDILLPPPPLPILDTSDLPDFDDFCLGM